MDLKTAIGAAEHAREMGHTSYMARAAVALLDELRRSRASQERDTQSIMSQHRRVSALVREAVAKEAPLMPAADARTLGGAS